MTQSDLEYGDYDQFKKIIMYSTYCEHFFPLAYRYVKTYPLGRLHIRSNLGEICRARYYTPPFELIAKSDESHLVKMVKIYNLWTQAKNHSLTYKEFNRYLEETQLIDQAHGFDLLSLYYWEHLMPVWHGALLLESDLSHDTLCLYNCRKLLSTFLAMPFEEQIEKKGMLNCIHKLWPSLLDDPINPNIDQVLAEINRYPPLTVSATCDGNVVVARCIAGSEHFQGDLEYAFYLMVDGVKTQVLWYTPNPEAQFTLPDGVAGKKLEVRGFVREVANPDKKVMKVAPVVE